MQTYYENTSTASLDAEYGAIWSATDLPDRHAWELEIADSYRVKSGGHSVSDRDYALSSRPWELVPPSSGLY
jgi:hypothetical protein